MNHEDDFPTTDVGEIIGVIGAAEGVADTIIEDVESYTDLAALGLLLAFGTIILAMVLVFFYVTGKLALSRLFGGNGNGKKNGKNGEQAYRVLATEDRLEQLERQFDRHDISEKKGKK